MLVNTYNYHRNYYKNTEVFSDRILLLLWSFPIWIEIFYKIKSTSQKFIYFNFLSVYIIESLNNLIKIIRV